MSATNKCFDASAKREFLKRARAPYGTGWAYLSDDYKDAIWHRHVLGIVLAQGLDKYAPAQTLAHELLEFAGKI